MKKFYILLVVLFLVNGAMAQIGKPCVPCLTQGITFTTQAQIDNFQSNYPGCTEIEGDVMINDAYTGNITNLSGLSVLTSIGGNLFIKGNPGLNSLTGLDILTSIGGDYFEIYDNNALTSLTGLENVTSIGGQFRIYGNDALTSLTAMENLTFIGGNLQIGVNAALTSLTGMQNLTFIGGDYFDIYYNNALTNLTGLEGLTSIVGDLGITDNYSLTSLTGLENLDSIGGDFGIFRNTALTSITALEGLTSIGSQLTISSNYNLTSLTGLENLDSIGGGLSIWANTDLTSLTALEGLTSIGGRLYIHLNDVLTSLLGLGNIASGSINDLVIVGNESLSNCAVQSICDYLATPNSSVLIYDNATGCNSQQEVDSACVFLSNGEVMFQPTFKIYPNPTSTALTIEISAKGSLSIHNTSGQQLLQREISESTTTIDVNGWKSGVYFVRVTGKKKVSVGKFVKH